MTQGGGSECLFNPRYSDCLKELLVQALTQQQLPQYDGHSCQGPVPALPAEAIDSGHLLEMRVGWGACAGPYPAFRMEQRGGPILTRENLLTVMRAKRLGPLRKAPPQQPQHPLPPPPTQLSESATPPMQPPDTCRSYRDRKDRSRFALPPAPQPARPRPSEPPPPPPMNAERHRIAQLHLSNKEADDAESPAAALAAAAASASAQLMLHPSGVAMMQGMVAPTTLSLSFSYDKFRERLARWEEAAAAAAAVAATVGGKGAGGGSGGGGSGGGGLRIRSVLAMSDGSSTGVTAAATAAAVSVTATTAPLIRGRQQRRRVASNPRR